MKMSPKESRDWCHLCGWRTSPLADIWYPDNAEHQTANTKYIRICVSCGERIANVAIHGPRI